MRQPLTRWKTRATSPGALLLLFCWAPPAGGQVPDAERLLAAVKRPYLSLGSLLQTVADFQIERSRPGHNGFTVPNFRVSLGGELEQRFGYFLQTNFAASTAILDARLHVRPSRSTRIDVGQFKVPFSAEFLTGAGDLDLVNRAAAVTALAPGRQIGVQGGVDLPEGVGLRAGVFNGTAAGANDNDAVLVAARVEVRAAGAPGNDGDGRLLLGASAGYSRDSTATLPGIPGTFEGDRILLGADARWTGGNWLLAGELIFARLDPPQGRVAEPFGHHLTAGYRFSPRAEGLLRWERFDPDGLAPTRDLLIGGLTWFPARFTRIRINYVIDTRNAGLEHHQLLLGTQFGF